MTDFGYTADRAQHHLRRAAHKASPFVEKFARVGYAAKGVIYCIVGILAAWTAFDAINGGGGTAGGAGQTTGSRGAMQTIADQPFGQILLAIVALGLACYSLWQFIRAIEDPENEGSDGKAVAKRIGFFISGVIHASLVIFATSIILGSGGGGGAGSDDSGAQSWSARVISYPAGQWALGLIGAGILIFGLFQIYKAYIAKLDDQLVLEGMSPDARKWTRYISRFGMAARGVVFGIIGTFLMIAAYQAQPQEARGLGGALRTLQEQPFGPWLLGIVALGLVAYGIYQFVKARYRRIEVA